MEQTHPPTKELALHWTQHFKSFPLIVWVVLIGTFISRVSYFMAWPFLVVFLYRDYGASELYVGTILAASAFVGAFSGSWLGYLSDRLGRRLIMLGGCALAGVAYSGIGAADQLWQFFTLMLMVGLMRPSIEAPGKALIGDYLAHPKAREVALNIRYFLINAGGAIGPLIGIYLGLLHPQQLFYATGIVYLIYGGALGWVFCYYTPKVQKLATEQSKLRLRAVLKVVRADYGFALLLLADICMLIAYSQYESSLPQIVSRSGLAHAGHWVGYLILVNTVTIVLLQFPLLSLLRHYRLIIRIRLGVILMLLAQVVLMFSSSQWPFGWLLGVFFLSVGESIIFPSLNVLIDQIAPDHLRGTYFGVASFTAVGFALGPLLGGLILQYSSAVSLYVLCFVLMGLSLWFFGRVKAGS
ncbi:MFS transporter [Celerinatantimonas diazotrophica]|uniref:Na+/melibiose symporter-like transporter n=1 Tax=Celerinatantimonas diazotrophica TaxID=412034 RepID=A0A4R1KGI7_9GAMM|nr:MFS transporter [Celerinatantimonas diazotrophica]TCK63307.1 Na+/melibiose symporter-like transporter [Celerinatantimonas diazotrophica]CAG9298451.1 Na(+), Li(+), K(+)/H(+) antiporter [Celerinatantimonas diazotrophica]